MSTRRRVRRRAESQPPERPCAIEKALDSDRRFFERWPYRRYRIRRAFPGEVEEIAEIAGVEFAPVPPGYVAAIIVQNLWPGVRLRQPILALRTNDFDVSEAEAAAVAAALRAGQSSVILGGPA